MVAKFTKFFRSLSKPMPLDSNFKDYDEYWDNRGFHAPSIRRAKNILQRVEPGSTFLDIGCGDGTVMEYLEKRANAKSIVGIDISSKAVEYVKSKGLKAHEYDVLSEAFQKFLKGKKFDYIIITEVLEHVQDAEVVIETLRRHVNKAVFASVPNAGFFPARLRLLFGRFPLVMIQQHIKEHIRFWTLKDFKYWAGYHGYNIDEAIVTAGTGVRPLAFLENALPSLFACQLMYKLSKNEEE